MHHQHRPLSTRNSVNRKDNISGKVKCWLTGNKTQRDNNVSAKRVSTSSNIQAINCQGLYLSPAPSLADGGMTKTDTSVNIISHQVFLWGPNSTRKEGQRPNQGVFKGGAIMKCQLSRGVLTEMFPSKLELKQLLWSILIHFHKYKEQFFVSKATLV